jgi:8-oxo-dGTP pyrophosphatase MutT (NUDIX family)
MSTVSGYTQISAGGVVYRQVDDQVEVALILVGPRERWQLPKGAVAAAETKEEAALREVREETGLTAELIEMLDRIEYWFNATRDGQRVRFHKFVYFYLMRFITGSVSDHDHEVVEARWIEIEQAIDLLAFESEKALVRKAREQILRLDQNDRQQPGGLNADRSPG